MNPHTEEWLESWHNGNRKDVTATVVAAGPAAVAEFAARLQMIMGGCIVWGDVKIFITLLGELTPRKIIYLVTTGSYSDYSVRSGWWNKSDAERVAAAQHDGRVEELELDSLEPDAAPREKYKYWFDAKGNCTYRGYGEEILFRDGTTTSTLHEDGRYYCEVWATTGEKAFKIATDMRTLELARRAGIT